MSSLLVTNDNDNDNFISSSSSSSIIQTIIPEGKEEEEEEKEQRLKDLGELKELKSTYQFWPSIPHGTKDIANMDWKTNPGWVILEKVDGSEFSFKVQDEYVEEEGGKKEVKRSIKFFNFNKEKDNSDSNFSKAVKALSEDISMYNPNYMYHSETIPKRRANVIQYDRVPRKYVQIFAIQEGKRRFTFPEVMKEAERIGLETVQVLHDNITNPTLRNPVDICLELISKAEKGEIESSLGGPIEGVVLTCVNFKKIHPNSALYPEFNKTIFVKFKFVTKLFKEYRDATKSDDTRIFTPSQSIRWIGWNFDLHARLNKAKQRLVNKNHLIPSSLACVYSQSKQVEKEGNNSPHYLTGILQHLSDNFPSIDLDKSCENIEKKIEEIFESNPDKYFPDQDKKSPLIRILEELEPHSTFIPSNPYFEQIRNELKRINLDLNQDSIAKNIVNQFQKNLITLELLEKELDQDLLKEHTQLIRTYLYTELSPLFTALCKAFNQSQTVPDPFKTPKIVTFSVKADPLYLRLLFLAEEHCNSLISGRYCKEENEEIVTDILYQEFILNICAESRRTILKDSFAVNSLSNLVSSLSI